MRPRGPAVRRGVPLSGRIEPPGDKSITHRAILFGLLARGETTVRRPNPGEDCGRSLAAAAALGAATSSDADRLVVAGNGPALSAPGAPLDCGNSGTTMRLLTGILAGQPFASQLFGDASLSRRPMLRILEPLAAMGAEISSAPGGLAPLSVHGRSLRGASFDLRVASAQVATCLILAGLSADGETVVRLPGAARDHTERMLPAFGVPLAVRPLAAGGREVRVAGGTALCAAALHVPGDFSAAAFFMAAAAATPGSDVTIVRVSLNPTRSAFLDVLREMGADLEVHESAAEAGEPLGDVRVQGCGRLRAFDVPAEWVPRMVDEVPAWVVVASAAEGVSTIRGAGELRVKESDRIAALARGLAACGIESREHPDGLEVRGGTARGARVETAHDHRIAMAFAALGARTAGAVTFDDVSSVATSHPGFFADLARLGAVVETAA